MKKLLLIILALALAFCLFGCDADKTEPVENQSYANNENSDFEAGYDAGYKAGYAAGYEDAEQDRQDADEYYHEGGAFRP